MDEFETPQERKQRRHLEDMNENPDRHFFNKDTYTSQEVNQFCFSCWNDERHKFEIQYNTMTIHRYKEVKDE